MEAVAEATRRVYAQLKGIKDGEAAQQKATPRVNMSNLDYETARGKFWEYCLLDAKENKYVFNVKPENRELLKNVVLWLIDDQNGEFDPNKGILLTGEAGAGKTTLFRIMQKFINKEGLFIKMMRVMTRDEVLYSTTRGGVISPNYFFPYLDLCLDDFMSDVKDGVSDADLEVLRIRQAVYYRQDGNKFCHVATRSDKTELIRATGVNFQIFTNLFNFAEIQ